MLINLGGIYFLVNVSYSGLESLQSTVNAHQGLGTTSIGVLYASLIASSLLVGPTVVDRLRAKKTLFLAWSANAVFAVANAFPRWETLVPASAFVGFTMASCNIVYGLYVTGSLIIGSGRLPGVSASDGVANSTNASTDVRTTTTDVGVCGVGHCPFVAEHIRAFAAAADPRLVFVVGAVFLLVVVAAAALTAVLGPLPTDRPCCRPSRDRVGAAQRRGDGSVSMRARIARTLRLTADVRFLLLIPSIVTMGVITSFAIGAFNQSFVACSLGIGMIGYANVGYRVTFVGASLLAGQLVRCVHRRTIIVAAMLTNVAVVGSWFAWTPPPSSAGVAVVRVAALMIAWCAMNGAVIGTLRAVFYSLFPLLFAATFDDALAQATVWDALGMSAAFFADSRFCFGAKAGAVMALTVAATATYGALEYVVARDGRRPPQRRRSASTDAPAATTSAHLGVVDVVLDASLIKNSDVKTKAGTSLLVDDNHIANANCD